MFALVISGTMETNPNNGPYALFADIPTRRSMNRDPPRRRFTSKADIGHVRFTPESGPSRCKNEMFAKIPHCLKALLGHVCFGIEADSLSGHSARRSPPRRLTADARAPAIPLTTARFADSRATTHRRRRRPMAPRPIHHRALRCRACAR
jgi:hypothetical protein